MDDILHEVPEIPNPQVSAAEILLGVLERERPPYPEKLLKELGAGRQGDWLSGIPFFRGWFGFIGDMPEFQVNFNDENGFGAVVRGDEELSYSGLWCCGVGGDRPIAWVSIPSMTFGTSLPGAVVNTGEEKFVQGKYEQKDMENLLRGGWSMIKALRDEHGPPKVAA